MVNRGQAASAIRRLRLSTDTRLLLVEDVPGNARLLREMLKEPGSHHIAVTHVETMIEAERRLAAGGTEIILLDLGLPDAKVWKRSGEL